ncbi:maleylpyruvate isomerase N-terminal domain-containing protein [Ktedonobacter racemifer]|uniref:DinB-like domain-containing protein n=1 Tax=Ktedonobacter racemifer DSM 44963 TaxID=485913 RepID=D6U0S3_KTERA|nr:maleylpyruvate isomerase N-terminal domain-containing protein [Ktedonobacter racemifer]EFH82413.1 hypothetical protein Krac_3224 [Ktedonobacter racemifer DSM 44963]
MNALDILKSGHQAILRTLEGFPDEAWDSSDACGMWSVKDIIAHLTSYEKVLVDVLGTFVGKEGPTPSLKKFKEMDAPQFNESEVALRKEKSGQDVLFEFNEAHGQVMSLAAQIRPEAFRQVGTLPWFGAEYALDDYIVYTFFGHKCEHFSRIAAFRDRVG